MTVARCPYCQQTIVGQIVAGDGGWTCPSCKRVVGTLVERGSGQTIVEPGAGSDAGQTIVESRPTPFRPEVVREAEPAASGANGDAKPPPAGDEGGTIAVGDRPLRTGPGGTDPLIGEVLGGCRILEVLGRGAMGTVYKATQLSLDRTVALKVIREELCTDDDLLSRFQREAKMVGRFSTPHVVQIHDVGRDKRVHFIVMEFVSGGSLLAHVNELPGRRLPPDVAIRYMIEAAEGLLEAERLGIIHRDIKPENLLLDHAGRVKVADFGISRSVTMSIELTATQAVIGTPLYMSPEQCRAEKVDHRSDMYSLGATFCHMLAGKRPLHEESVQELLRKKTTMEFLSPRRLAQDGSIPESLSRVIERMTALDRADRYPTFKEVVEDLRRVERGELIEPFQRKAARARMRRRLVKATVTAVVLSVAGYGAYRGYQWWQERHPGPETDGGTRVPAGLTAAQLDLEANELRAKLVDPRLLNTGFIVAERSKIRSAVDGPDSGPALRLAKLCDDAQRLVDYRENSESLRPPPFTPPFGELEERWKKLRETADAARPEASGKEVRDYVRLDLENREKSDRTKAIAALTKSLDELERRVKDGLPTADLRGAATRELDDVVAGRSALERLFPGDSGAIVAAAPDDRCSKLREAIAKLEATAVAPTPEAPLTAAAAKKRLGELTQEFQTSGPTHVMEADARAMRSRLQEGSDEWAQVGSFLEFVTRGNDVLLQLDALRNQQPPAIRPPFEELATFRERCSGAIHLDAVDPDWYRSYFEKEPTRRLAPFKVGAQDAFTILVGDWRKSSAEISGGGGDAAAFEKLHQQVGDSRKNLKAAFGDQSKFATDVLGDAEFDKVARDFDRLSALRVRVAEGLRLLDEAARALEGVTSCGAWRERGPAQITPKIEAARKVLDEVRVADARAVDAATQAKLSDVEGRAGRWSDLVRRLDEAIRHVGGDHDLAAARGELDGIGASDDPTVKQAKLAVERLTAAFDALIKDLDLARARSGFEEAQRALAEAAPTLTYAADCRARVAELEKVVGSGMARVSAGRVHISGSIRFAKTDQPIEVAAFWLDSCETSIGQFQQFLKEVASDKTTVARLLPTLPGLSGESVDAAMEKLATPPAPPAHLAGVKRPDPRLPIEKVSYAQAVVCLARQEKSLPTLEEWWLAAKGSLNQRAEHRRFPWNDSSNARLESALGTTQVCARMSRPTQVDQGGDVLGFDTIKVHHLSGNVEEWTQAVPSGQDGKSGHLESRIIGGSYDDEDEARFSGDQPRYADVTAEQDLSTGFRGVVRPREFFAAKGLAPKGP